MRVPGLSCAAIFSEQLRLDADRPTNLRMIAARAPRLEPARNARRPAFLSVHTAGGCEA